MIKLLTILVLQIGQIMGKCVYDLVGQGILQIDNIHSRWNFNWNLDLINFFFNSILDF